MYEEIFNIFNTYHYTSLKVREILMNILFYSDNKYDASDDLISITTFINNVSIIPLSHSNEVYLAYAKASKKYDNNKKKTSYF